MLPWPCIETPTYHNVYISFYIAAIWKYIFQNFLALDRYLGESFFLKLTYVSILFFCRDVSRFIPSGPDDMAEMVEHGS